MEKILKKLKSGEITLKTAESLLKKNFSDTMKLKFVAQLARLDIHREERIGIPEVVFAEGKKSSWAVKIIKEMAKERGRAIVTRVNKKLIKKIKESIGTEFTVKEYRDARIITVKKKGYKIKKTGGIVGLIAAGTSDLPVAEEARVILKEFGCKVIYAYDVGIAGVHRVFEPLEEMLLKKVSVIIVAAGMDAVLPITVKGMVNLPVIGVPTSVGYGVGAGGIAPLLTMLQSCSPGLVVVNIDNGFGAAAAAALIARK